MTRLLDIAQRSDEWRALRVGLLTGSRAPDMLAMLKNGGEAAARRDLRLQLACERLTGVSAEDRYVSREMQRGIDREPDAIAAYEALTGSLVTRVGFLQHDDLQTGCSPDGFVDEDGVLEVKCPKSTTHLGYLRSGMVPSEYLGQVLHALWLSERTWCDFVSFDDRFPPPLQLFRARVWRNATDLRAYELLVRNFLAEVERDADAVAGLIR